jgi:hypothetical protein
MWKFNLLIFLLPRNTIWKPNLFMLSYFVTLMCNPTYLFILFTLTWWNPKQILLLSLLENPNIFDRMMWKTNLIIFIGQTVGVSFTTLVLSALHEGKPLVWRRPLSHQAVLRTLKKMVNVGNLNCNKYACIYFVSWTLIIDYLIHKYLQ